MSNYTGESLRGMSFPELGRALHDTLGILVDPADYGCVGHIMQAVIDTGRSMKICISHDRLPDMAAWVTVYGGRGCERDGLSDDIRRAVAVAAIQACQEVRD